MTKFKTSRRSNLKCLSNASKTFSEKIDDPSNFSLFDIAFAFFLFLSRKPSELWASTRAQKLDRKSKLLSVQKMFCFVMTRVQAHCYRKHSSLKLTASKGAKPTIPEDKHTLPNKASSVFAKWICWGWISITGKFLQFFFHHSFSRHPEWKEWINISSSRTWHERNVKWNL